MARLELALPRRVLVASSLGRESNPNWPRPVPFVRHVRPRMGVAGADPVHSDGSIKRLPVPAWRGRGPSQCCPEVTSIQACAGP